MMAPRSRGGRWVVIPDGGSEAQARMNERYARRRQNRIMLLLVLMAVATGAWALVGEGAAISIHLAIDVVAICYGALLYESRRRRSERRRKVRSLARHPLAAPAAQWPVALDGGVDDQEPLFVDDQIAL